MYLVHRDSVQRGDGAPPSCAFAVLGSTGNLYNVVISQISACDCPDAQKARGSGSSLCKHILFVLLKVAGLRQSDPRVYQAALLNSELEEIFGLIVERSRGGGERVVANANVRNAYAQKMGTGEVVEAEESATAVGNAKGGEEDSGGIKRKNPEEQPECLICFDSMDFSQSSGWGKEICFCRTACGNNFHVACIQKWLSSSAAMKKQYHKSDNGPTCPACRSPWVDVSTINGKASASSPRRKQKRSLEEGYENFGAEAGLSSARDTSTYNSSYDSYSFSRRRRRW